MAAGIPAATDFTFVIFKGLVSAGVIANSFRTDIIMLE